MKQLSLSAHAPRFRRWSRKSWSVFASFHREVSIGVLSVGMSLVLFPAQSLSARQADTTLTMRTQRIREVSIRGKQSAAMRNALSATPLFDRKADAGAPCPTLESALRLHPSIDIRERGGKGTQADISIRGGSFDQTMILLNGIDFTDARTGHQSHSLPIDMEAVSSVELIDGLPGVGAYAGAVHIRTAPLRPEYLRAELSGGAHAYAYANLSGAVTRKRLALFAAASMRHSDGYRHNTDFDTYNAYLRLTADARRGGMFDMQAGYQDRRFGSNGFYAAYNPDQWEHTSTAIASLRWTKQCGHRIATGASVGYRKNFDRYDWTRGTPMNRHNTDNVSARLWADLKGRHGVTTLGGDYTYNHIYSTNLGERMEHPVGDYLCAKSRHTGNVWLRHALRLGRFDLSASGGACFTPYGNEASWNVAAGWTPRSGLRLDAGVWRSMRLPTFTDLYYTGPAQINNLDLVPERATNVRLGLAWTSSRWSASLNGYFRAGRNVIDWVWREDMGGKWHSEQSSRMNTCGVEWTGGYLAEEGFLRQITLSYAYTHSGQENSRMSRNAMDYLRHKAVARFRLALLRPLVLSLTGTLSDRNGNYTFYPTAGDPSNGIVRPFKASFIVDARLEWTPGRLSLYVEGSNLTDRSHFDLGGIPLPGIWVSAGAVFTLGRKAVS